jgi:Arc/MetJ-type ribon-helix-helix transcriptional regulator
MSGPTVATSVRLPEELQRAAKEAVAHGLAGSLTELIVDGLRDRLVALALADQQYVSKAEAQAALEEHYAEHPGCRPSLAEVVLVGARLFGEAAADRPDLIDLAVADLGEEADPEEVLSWVKGAMAAETKVESEVA